MMKSVSYFTKESKALSFFLSLANNADPIIFFLDINMPVMNGWDLLNIIQQDHSDHEVWAVIVTSSVDEGDKESAFSFPKVIELVEKPLSVGALNELKLKLPWIIKG